MERKPRCVETLMEEFICGDAGKPSRKATFSLGS